MLKPAPPLRPRKRRVVKAAAVKRGPVLVSATYYSGTMLLLTFDRAVSSDALDPNAIVVLDQALQQRIVAEEVDRRPTPESISLTLLPGTAAPVAATVLNVAPGNGVADDDGTPWAGVVDFPL